MPEVDGPLVDDLVSLQDEEPLVSSDGRDGARGQHADLLPYHG